MSSEGSIQVVRAGRRIVALIGAAIVVLAGVVAMIGLVVSPANAAEGDLGTGSITGRVTGPGGVPLDPHAELEIEACGEGCSYVDVDEATGQYSFDRVPAGEWFGSFWIYDGATIYGSKGTSTLSLLVPADGSVANADIELELRDSVTGKVSGPGPAPLEADARFRVSAYDAYNEYVAWGRVDNSSGSYRVGMSESGSTIAKLEFSDDSGHYVTKWVKGLDLTVPAGGTITGPDVELALADAITGKISGPDDAPLKTDSDLYVSAFDADGEYVGEGRVDNSAGSYRVGMSRSGSTAAKLRFYDYSDHYAVKWVEDLNLTAPIGGSIAGPDVQLELAGSITGNLTGLGGAPLTAGSRVRVAAYDAQGDLVGDDYGLSGGRAGTYELRGLTPGSTVTELRFSDRYLWYVDKTIQDLSLPVPAGGTIAGPDVELDATGAIAGHVTGPSDAPLAADADIYVSAYDADGNSFPVDPTYAYSPRVNPYTGSYRVRGLDGVTIAKLTFYDGSGTYATKSVEGLDLTAPAGGTIAGPDVQLELAASITGEVTGPNGAALDPDTYVEILAYDGDRRVGDDYIGPSDKGAFRIGGLTDGSQITKITASDSDGTYRSATKSFDPALVIEAGKNAGVGKLELAKSGGITGTITGPSGAALDSGSDLYVTAYAGDRWLGSGHVNTYADQKGAFRINGLADDAHVTKLMVYDNSGRYQDRTVDVVLTVPAGQAVAAGNIELKKAGAIIGKVTGPAGAALSASSSINVSAYNGDRQVGTTGYVTGLGGETGGFRIGGLADDAQVTSLKVRDGARKYQDRTVDVVLTVPAGQEVAAETIELAKAGAITGKVTGPGGAKLSDSSSVLLTAYNGDQQVGDAEYVDGYGGTGTFRIDGLADDATVTHLKIHDGAGWYHDRTAPVGVTVPAGKVVAVGNIELAKAGAINGSPV